MLTYFPLQQHAERFHPPRDCNLQHNRNTGEKSAAWLKYLGEVFFYPLQQAMCCCAQKKLLRRHLYNEFPLISFTETSSSLIRLFLHLPPSSYLICFIITSPLSQQNSLFDFTRAFLFLFVFFPLSLFSLFHFVLIISSIVGVCLCICIYAHVHACVNWRWKSCTVIESFRISFRSRKKKFDGESSLACEGVQTWYRRSRKEWNWIEWKANRRQWVYPAITLSSYKTIANNLWTNLFTLHHWRTRKEGAGKLSRVKFSWRSRFSISSRVHNIKG